MKGSLRCCGQCATAIAPLGAAWLAACAQRSSRTARGGLARRLHGRAGPGDVLVNAVVSQPRQLILTTWQAGANFYIRERPGGERDLRGPRFVTANRRSRPTTSRTGRPVAPGVA